MQHAQIFDIMNNWSLDLDKSTIGSERDDEQPWPCPTERDYNFAQKAKLHAASLIICNAKELQTANSSTTTDVHSTLVE